MKINVNKCFESFMLFLFYIINLYYYYRYIFKYNSESTSPTYSNTPIAYQITKYIILVIATIMILLYLLKYVKKIKVGIIEILFLFMYLIILLKRLFDSSFNFSIQIFLIFIPAYAILFVEDDELSERIKKAFFLVLLYHIIYSVVQIYLYITQNRLPALGYSGGLVRFGGGWDDPNAFSIFLTLPITYLICDIIENKAEFKKIFLLLVCLGLDIITFSFAGYVGLAIVITLIFFKYIQKSKLWGYFCLVVPICSILLFLNFNSIQELIRIKNPSASSHLEQLIIKSDSALSFFFGSFQFKKYENFYYTLASNYGIFALVLFCAIEIYFIHITYLNVQREKNDIFMFTIFCFLIAFAISQLGIPYFGVFPVNYIYLFLSSISLKKYRNSRGVKS